MNKAIITGPTGAIGIALIERMIKENIEVLAICHKDSQRIFDIPKNPLVHVVECNLDSMRDLPEMLVGQAGIVEKELSEIGRKQAADAVFYHLAWDGTFGNTRDNVEGQIRNVQYTIDAVEAACRLGCKRFIGAGSQAEYGRVDAAAYPRITPDTPTFPENGYGIAKLCAGAMSRLKCEQLGMEHVWTRILSVYGPYDGANTLISSMIRKLINGEHVSCTKGEQMWDYLYSTDAAEALYLLGSAEREKVDGKTYVLGNGNAKPLKEYMEIVRKIVRSEAELGIGEVPYSEKQVMYLVPDISRLERDTGFKPEVSFEEGIRKTIAWIQASGYGYH